LLNGQEQGAATVKPAPIFGVHLGIRYAIRPVRSSRSTSRQRKRAEAALRASERQFHTLADCIPQLVWMAEAGGKIFWFNNHWHEYTGTLPDRTAGANRRNMQLF